MITRSIGAAFTFPRPFYEEGGEGGGGGGEPGAGDNGGEGGAEGGFVFDAGKAFEGLEADNLEWLQKAGLNADPKALAKHAYNQEKLLGNAIRIPKDDAPQEERDAFLSKLGRPKTADEYQLEAPKDLPEGLPYDGELAGEFKALAHKLGLNQQQAAGLHDMFVQYSVKSFGGAAEQQTAQLEARAKAATDALVKEWGPIDGDTAKANFEIADKVFTMAPGGQDVLAELKAAGLIGPNKEILSPAVAKLFASIGTLYTEDRKLTGDATQVGNPFAKGESFNLTLAMQIARNDPERAASLINAAGLSDEEKAVYSGVLKKAA